MGQINFSHFVGQFFFFFPFPAYHSNQLKMNSFIFKHVKLFCSIKPKIPLIAQQPWVSHLEYFEAYEILLERRLLRARLLLMGLYHQVSSLMKLLY